MQKLKEIEERFKEYINLEIDLSEFPTNNMSIQNISKERCVKFGEVFTPIWLVDKMIQKIDIKKLYKNITSLDLCAGYGHFTIRLMRSLYNYNNNFNIDNFLKRHYFAEYQLESCYKLLKIFGTNINLFIGDASALCQLTQKHKNGIWLHDGYTWISLKGNINNIMESEETFVKKLKTYIKQNNKRYNDISPIKFDICFSNPPYNGGIDRKILLPIYHMLNTIVIVHPSTWLISRKKTRQYMEFREMIGCNLVSVELFNGNPIFNISLFVPVVIAHIDKDKTNNEIDVNYFNDHFIADNINEISIFGSNWKPLVKPFMLKMQNIIKEYGCIQDHVISFKDIKL